MWLRSNKARTIASGSGSSAKQRLWQLALVCLAGTLVQTTGCAYLRERALDAVDVIHVVGGIGWGLHADVKASDYLHLGVGYAEIRKAGLSGRDVVWQRDREVGLPVSALPWIGALREGTGARLGHFHLNVQDLLAYEDPWRRADVGASVTAGLFTVGCGFSPGQLVDFLAGLVGFDPASDDRGSATPPPSAAGLNWVRGDLHVHCTPPDKPSHATNSPEQLLQLASTDHFGFLGLNPHLFTGSQPLLQSGTKKFLSWVETQSQDAGAGPALIHGFEVTSSYGSNGHALLLTRKPLSAYRFASALSGGELATKVRETLPDKDCLLIPTHPRTRRLKIPYYWDLTAPWPGAGAFARPGPYGLSEELTVENVVVVRCTNPPADRQRLVEMVTRERERAGNRRLKILHIKDGETIAKLSYWGDPQKWKWEEPSSPFTNNASTRDFSRHAFDGLEALTLGHHLGELAVGRRGDELAVNDVFPLLDRRIAQEHKRYIATGGSDNHRELLQPTTWVLAKAGTTADVFDALVAGRIVVGGIEASSFEARSDLDPKWQPIGADLQAGSKVALRWQGTATLVVDGSRHPPRKDGYTHSIQPGSFHFYRLEAGPGSRSRSNWIYVNR